ncbi:hypothetical protein ACQPXM_06585 [Kribbella sp. CA-253562]|uniref:hypothetical protein n=1 Tax=Kribbella sp. CA-253562 TaxID=3239942 RepID=UPI003D8DDFD5
MDLVTEKEISRLEPGIAYEQGCWPNCVDRARAPVGDKDAHQLAMGTAGVGHPLQGDQLSLLAIAFLKRGPLLAESLAERSCRDQRSCRRADGLK